MWVIPRHPHRHGPRAHIPLCAWEICESGSTVATSCGDDSRQGGGTVFKTEINEK